MSAAGAPAWEGAVPSRLRGRIGELVAGAGASGPAGWVAVAVATAGRLVQDESAGRPAALDLLAADALVTHAMERMADNPDDLDAACLAAMADLSSIVPAR